MLCKALKEKSFIITAEVAPPKGTDTDKMRQNIKLIKDLVDAINVTDNQSSCMHMCSLCGALVVKEEGQDPIMQMTTRDRNRMAIQSDLLGAWALGIKNILCMSGDHLSLGDHPTAKQVSDIDSVQLIKLVSTLKNGFDLAGNKLEGKPDFIIGAVASPANFTELSYYKLIKKIEAGATFIQTQPIFDIDLATSFIEKIKEFKVKILIGILLIASLKMLRYIEEHVAGISIPSHLALKFSSLEGEDQLKYGISLAGDLIRKIRQEKIADGVHIMAIQREKYIPKIIEASL